MELKIALKVDDKDNVATIFANGITDGTEVEIRDKKGNVDLVNVIGDIPYGHKIAVRDIKKDEAIMKYGESIGGASQDIKKGEYQTNGNHICTEPSHPLLCQDCLYRCSRLRGK